MLAVVPRSTEPSREQITHIIVYLWHDEGGTVVT